MLGENEMMLIEHSDEYILCSQIIHQRLNIGLQQTDWPTLVQYYVQQVYDPDAGKCRLIDLISPIRAKLELEAFGCAYLISKLQENVKSFPLIIFIDDFGLYKNIYKLLTGVYAMPADLLCTECQKSSNSYTITLGLYESNFNNVMSCLEPSLGAIDRCSVLDINGHVQPVWAPVLAFLGNMKQQGDFLEQKPIFAVVFVILVLRTMQT